MLNSNIKFLVYIDFMSLLIGEIKHFDVLKRKQEIEETAN